MEQIKIRADFNGLFGDVLCISHKETCLDENGKTIQLREGMNVLAYDEDADEEGNRDNLLACGKVERAPDWLRSHGSKWVLRVDGAGVYHESDQERLDRSEPA